MNELMVAAFAAGALTGLGVGLMVDALKAGRKSRGSPQMVARRVATLDFGCRVEYHYEGGVDGQYVGTVYGRHNELYAEVSGKTRAELLDEAHERVVFELERGDD